jgi:hypothetical protein
LLLLKQNVALDILNDIENYTLTSEDFGSKKKSKNFLKLATNCFQTNNCVEGLNYLNKAIINQCECENIIDNYLKRAIEHNLYVEFFDFLKSGFENDLKENLLKYNQYIEEGFKKFLNSINTYSFFNILNINESLNVVFEFINLNFMNSLLNKFEKLVTSSNLNEKYFALYIIKRNIGKLVNINPLFKELIRSEYFESSKEEFLHYFHEEIDNLGIIDKLKLMKKQFEIFEIPKEKYYPAYKNYKNEIKELEKKIYLKKFSFLKLLMEKHNIKKSRGEFKKKRNTYVVRHEDDNLSKPVYNYIIKTIGFYGINESTIKSTDIGINLFIINELFLDDFSAYPDIFYYKKQFWGDDNEFEINSLDGFSLLSESMSYNYDIDQHFSNIKDIMIIEWDLANKPRQGSIVNAYGSQIIIPDQNNPLFHDLKPFDLCFCLKTPVKIEGNIIKTVSVITKCSFKDAIDSIVKGMSFIEGYYPLSLIISVLNKDITPFKANEIATSNSNKTFIPNYNKFLKSLREFLFEFIKKERNYIFQEIKSDLENNVNNIISLLNLKNELAGLHLPYLEIIQHLLEENMTLSDFKIKFLNKIHILIKETLKKRDLGCTTMFNLKKLRNTQFFKYSNEILQIRKEEFEKAKIFRVKNEKNEIWFDISEVRKTFYGIKFSPMLNVEGDSPINPKKIQLLINFASKLKLKLNILESNLK